MAPVLLLCFITVVAGGRWTDSCQRSYNISTEEYFQNSAYLHQMGQDKYIMNIDYTIITQWHNAECFLGLLFYTKVNQKGILALYCFFLQKKLLRIYIYIYIISATSKATNMQKTKQQKSVSQRGHMQTLWQGSVTKCNVVQLPKSLKN